MADTELVPYRDEVVDENRKLSGVWSSFFRTIQDLIFYIKKESSFQLVNNQSVAANLSGLSFDKRYHSQAVIEYLIQRVSTSSELIESGRAVAVYLPDSDTWNISQVDDISVGVVGVVLSITSLGQVQYTTSNQAGTISISRIVYRVRHIEAKSQSYSAVG
jgi:uncharacterized protein YehS (DUF1456 family)